MMSEIRDEYDWEEESEEALLSETLGLTSRTRKEVIKGYNVEYFSEEVCKLHFEENTTLQEIAKILGVSVHTIYRCFRKNEWTPQMSTVRKQVDEQTLRHLYYNERLSQKKIAEKMGVSLSTIYRRFKEYDMNARRIGTRNEIDVQEIHHLHFDQGLAFQEIAERLDISPRTISRVFNDQRWSARKKFVYTSEGERLRAAKEKGKRFRLKIQELRDSLFGTVCKCCGVDKSKSDRSLPIHRKDGVEHEQDALWRLGYLKSLDPDEWVALCVPCHRGVTWLQKELDIQWQFVESAVSSKRGALNDSAPYTTQEDAVISDRYKEIKETFDGKNPDLVRAIFGETCHFCDVHYMEKTLVTHRKDGRSHQKDLFRKESNFRLLNPNDWVSLCRKHHRYVHWAMDTLGMRWDDF